MEDFKMKEAMFYESLGDNAVKCNLCSQRCKIADLKRGICAVRENRNGRLYSLVYGKVVARAVDPIEKNPYLIFFQVRGPIRSPRWDATSGVRTVRILRFLRCLKPVM
jgi:hypothetical protein